jgi:hypothetical protein
LPATCSNNVCGCTPDPDPCPTGQCSGSVPDGCGGTVLCQASCSLAGECPCAGGVCKAKFCLCNGGPCV